MSEPTVQDAPVTPVPEPSGPTLNDILAISSGSPSKPRSMASPQRQSPPEQEPDTTPSPEDTPAPEGEGENIDSAGEEEEDDDPITLLRRELAEERAERKRLTDYILSTQQGQSSLKPEDDVPQTPPAPAISLTQEQWDEIQDSPESAAKFLSEFRDGLLKEFNDGFNDRLNAALNERDQTAIRTKNWYDKNAATLKSVAKPFQALVETVEQQRGFDVRQLEGQLDAILKYVLDQAKEFRAVDQPAASAEKARPSIGAPRAGAVSRRTPQRTPDKGKSSPADLLDSLLGSKRLPTVGL